MNELSSYKGIPGMTPPVIHEYLRGVGRGWTGQGVAVELGCWLGATAAPLLEGLIEAHYKLLFYAYDRWEASRAEAIKARDQGHKLKKGQDLLPIFMENVKQIYPSIAASKGDIGRTLKWDGQPVEICIFDAPKRNPVFGFALRQLGAAFIPGVTTLGLLDYWFFRRSNKSKRHLTSIPHRFMMQHREHFTRLAQWKDQCSCAFFRYEGGIDWEDVIIE